MQPAMTEMKNISAMACIKKFLTKQRLRLTAVVKLTMTVTQARIKIKHVKKEIILEILEIILLSTIALEIKLKWAFKELSHLQDSMWRAKAPSTSVGIGTSSFLDYQTKAVKPSV